jgi:hypothetical protein
MWNQAHDFNAILKPRSATKDMEQIKAIVFFNDKVYNSNIQVFTNNE